MRVMDLFRDWDDDGNGTIDKKEFRRAIAALGYAAPRAEIDGLFDKFDADRSGEIEYPRSATHPVTDGLLRNGH